MSGAMDRSNLRLAAKLLVKAEDTRFEAEAAALAEKAYVLLADFLNGLEEGEPGAEPRKRRERRLLRDRRLARRMFGGGPRTSGATTETTYRQDGGNSGEHGGGNINFKA